MVSHPIRILQNLGRGGCFGSLRVLLALLSANFHDFEPPPIHQYMRMKNVLCRSGALIADKMTRIGVRVVLPFFFVQVQELAKRKFRLVLPRRKP